MSPIEGISDIRLFPRLGKIRLGIKIEGQRGPYPKAVDYFVCPEEVQAVYKDQPKELDIMFPADELELVAPQWYKCYSYSHGLICKGDGKTCKRKVDTKTRDFAKQNTLEWVLSDGICQPEHCPMIGVKQCRRMMSLLFILPAVPGLGVYQLDTSSFYSIVNMNSQLATDGFIRKFTRGKIAFIPLVLSIAPREITPPGVGRITTNVLHVTAKVRLADIIRISRRGPAQVLLPTLEEEEPPDDLYPDEVLIEAEVKREEVPHEQPGEQPEKVEGVRKKSTKPPPPAHPAQPAISSMPDAAAEQYFTPPDPSIEGEGFNLPKDWLDTTLKTIHWEEETAKTWIANVLKVDTKGKLTDVLAGLSREQAERFTDEINGRAARVQPGLL